MFTSILLIGIIGAIISAVVGTIWYNPGLTPMGRWHMQYLGFDKLTKAEQDAKIKAAKPQMWKSYSAQLLLSLLTSLFIGAVTGFSVQNGAPANSIFYYVPAIWLSFTVPMIGQNILWGTTEGSLAWKKFFSECGSNLITYLLVAFVATLFF